MNIESFIAKYNGKVVGDGQCGSLVRAFWNEVDRTVPPSYTNSVDYWFNPVPGYSKTGNPQPGDIAIYNGHGVYPEGHSAIYVGGQVFEQNADPDGSPAHLFNRANTYLLGYLSKGGSMARRPIDPELVYEHYINYTGVNVGKGSPPTQNRFEDPEDDEFWFGLVPMMNNIRHAQEAQIADLQKQVADLQAQINTKYKPYQGPALYTQ